MSLKNLQYETDSITIYVFPIKQMLKGSCFITILEYIEAFIALFLFFSLLKPQIREDSPAISPTTNSTAPFGLKPRSGKFSLFQNL